MDGGEAVGAIIAGIIGFALAIMAAWIALTTILRTFAYIILYYYPIATSIGLVAGILCAVVVFLDSIASAGRRTERRLTPADVADKNLFGKPPRGEAKHFGWDRAWPRYVPFQAELDIGVAARAAFTFLVSTAKYIGQRTSNDFSRPIAVGIYVVFGLLPHIAFAISFTVIVTLVTLVCIGFVLLAWIMQIVTIFVLRGIDVATRRIFRLSTRCVKCYEVTPLPSYLCSGCTIIHRDLRPGRLGVLWHRCECSAVLPTMVTRASGWSLRKNIVCPSCGHGLPEGTGSRQTIQIPTFGSVGVGKTRLLLAAVIGLRQILATTATDFRPLDIESGVALEHARKLIETCQPTTKTPHGPNPEALGVLVEPERGRPVELHLLDAAGEHFTTGDGAASLHYLHSAETLLFVIDPFSTDEMRAAVTDPTAVGLVVGQNNPEDSYSATIELLRSNGLQTAKRALGIVVTKADDLRRLGFDDELDPTDQDSIRAWLVARGLDNLTTRARQDFKQVRYFLTDSMGNSVTDPMHPVHVIEWLASRVGVQLVPGAIAN